jgi:hypothetical protein
MSALASSDEEIDNDNETYGKSLMYVSTPMGQAAMHALKHLLHTTESANEATLARAIHDHIGAVGICQDELFSASTTNRVIARAIQKCPPHNDYVLDLAADTIKFQLSKVYGFEPRYAEEHSDEESI